MRGASRVRVSWENEPGDVRWEFYRNGDDVNARIGLFEDEYADVPYRELIDATVSRRDLAAAIASGARQLRDAIGEEEYVNQWVRHPFPAHDLHELDRLLNGANESTLAARFGTEIDSVSLWLYDTGDSVGMLECDLKVDTGRFAATVTATLRRQELHAFDKQLHALTTRTTALARLTTTNGACELVVGDRPEVSGIISDGPQRSLNFTIPCTEKDITIASTTLSRIIKASTR